LGLVVKYYEALVDTDDKTPLLITYDGPKVHQWDDDMRKKFMEKHHRYIYYFGHYMTLKLQPLDVGIIAEIKKKIRDLLARVEECGKDSTKVLSQNLLDIRIVKRENTGDLLATLPFHYLLPASRTFGMWNGRNAHSEKLTVWSTLFGIYSVSDAIVAKAFLTAGVFPVSLTVHLDWLKRQRAKPQLVTVDESDSEHSDAPGIISKARFAEKVRAIATSASLTPDQQAEMVTALTRRHPPSDDVAFKNKSVMDQAIERAESRLIYDEKQKRFAAQLKRLNHVEPDEAKGDGELKKISKKKDLSAMTLHYRHNSHRRAYQDLTIEMNKKQKEKNEKLKTLNDRIQKYEIELAKMKRKTTSTFNNKTELLKSCRADIAKLTKEWAEYKKTTMKERNNFKRVADEDEISGETFRDSTATSQAVGKHIIFDDASGDEGDDDDDTGNNNDDGDDGDDDDDVDNNENINKISQAVAAVGKHIIFDDDDGR
jgi:hypothetical protein